MTRGLYLVITLLVFELGVECGRLPGSKASENSVDENKNMKTEYDFIDFLGRPMREAIQANPATFVAVYRMESEQGVAFVIDDHARNIRVVRPAGVDACVAMPKEYDRTYQSGEEFATWQTAGNSSMSEESITITIDTGKPPLSRTDFLCDEANDVCKGFSIYWGFTIYRNNGGRSKRQTTTTTTTTTSGGTTTTTTTTTTVG